MKKLQLEELNRVSVEAYKKQKKASFCILLDNVRSLHNVGAAFRTADAFRAEKLWLGGITGTPPHREINKTALGATESVAWEHGASSLDIVQKLQSDGYTIICIEQTDGSVLLNNFMPSKTDKYCFVFGNEVFGVEDPIIDIADQWIEIPQFGTKHSLNVSVTVGIVLWDFFAKCGI